jgi:hypothetical protein
VKPLSHHGLIEEDRAVSPIWLKKQAPDFMIKFREYLEANGYDTSMMGLGLLDGVSTESSQVEVKNSRSSGENENEKV